MLTPVLPPSACTSCRLCCHFLPGSAWESPALEPACAERLQALGVPLAERPEGGMAIALNFAPECPQEAVDCPLLDRSSGCRLPRAERPLECRLWPLRLMRDTEGGLVLACYRACPGLASVPEAELVAFASSLRPLLEERAAAFPESVRPWHANYRILFRLKDSSALPCVG